MWPLENLSVPMEACVVFLLDGSCLLCQEPGSKHLSSRQDRGLCCNYSTLTAARNQPETKRKHTAVAVSKKLCSWTLTFKFPLIFTCHKIPFYCDFPQPLTKTVTALLASQPHKTRQGTDLSRGLRLANACPTRPARLVQWEGHKQTDWVLTHCSTGTMGTPAHGIIVKIKRDDTDKRRAKRPAERMETRRHRLFPCTAPNPTQQKAKVRGKVFSAMSLPLMVLVPFKCLSFPLGLCVTFT